MPRACCGASPQHRLAHVPGSSSGGDGGFAAAAACHLLPSAAMLARLGPAAAPPPLSLRGAASPDAAAEGSSRAWHMQWWMHLSRPHLSTRLPIRLCCLRALACVHVGALTARSKFCAQVTCSWLEQHQTLAYPASSPTSAASESISAAASSSDVRNCGDAPSPRCCWHAVSA